MKLPLLAVLLAFSLVACQKDKDALPQPDSADWYVLRAPDDRAIEAVTGDIDGTLVITTRFEIYQTKDRGKTWKTGKYASNSGIFAFSQQQDTLLLLTTGWTSGLHPDTEYATGPSSFSLDDGLTWHYYRDWRPERELRVPRNHVTTTAGTEYSIDYLLTPVSPTSASSYIEYVGIKTSTGQQLTLPQDHQISSLYFDAKSRLYVTASAPLCGGKQEFKYCGTSNGTLYVSKKPQL